jgi:hypothetical protein
MSPFSSSGTIRQEDIFACNIARSAIARSLALEARKTELLVSDLITTNETITLPIADLWKQIQADATLRSFARNTDAHVDAYTQFAGWVEGARSRLAYIQKRRLLTAFGPRLHAHRFRNSDRLTRLHLLVASVPA